MRYHWFSCALWLVCLLAGGPLRAATVSQLEVRITTGERELIAGSSLELRIYEAGKPPRKFPLLHGEPWLPASTHLIPLKLAEPLDPRNVVRFALSYRSPVAAAGGIDIVSAEVELSARSGSPERLLGTALSGVIGRSGELATEERDQTAVMCRTDADCDDQRMCNGTERCAPRTAGADARGCVRGTPMVCPVNQICSEGKGCRGLEP